jgi:hypothetical protein
MDERWARPAPGDRCRLAGREWTIEALLGVGAEGEVWRIRSEEIGAAAWKRFHAANEDETRRTHLEWLIEQPSPSRHFLWPRELTDGEAGLGYIMDLRPPGAIPAGRLRRGVAVLSTGVTLAAALDLSAAVSFLHSDGLVFRDLSPGNLFVDPATGRVTLCDVDNAARQDRSVPRVRGTKGFIAPEVADGSTPAGRDADLYSLAALIKLLLFPGRGDRAHSDTQSEWPSVVVALLERANGPGATEVDHRVQATEWRLAFETALAQPTIQRPVS